MLALAPLTAALLALAATTPQIATATFGWGLRAHSNWGCSSSHAPVVQKQHCTTSGSFFTFCDEIQTALCCSSKTRIPPRDVTCPFGWDQHNSYKVCLPPKEQCEFDCGEGYTWNKKSLKCLPSTGGKCGRQQWWHPRSSSCCPSNPPKPGKCPSDRSCPKDWYWCSSTRKCRPNHPRSPEPDCDNWSESNQCCMHHPTPSQGSHHKKRDEQRRLAISDANDEVAERNAFYCPAPMTACPVVASASNATASSLSTSPEWSYECIDTQAELESCGGCLSEGQGQDCTAIAGAKNVGCGAGRCEVYSCLTGWKIGEDKASCVRA